MWEAKNQEHFEKKSGRIWSHVKEKEKKIVNISRSQNFKKLEKVTL